MVASLLITFREALEAALIVGIIAAYLAKVNRGDLNRYLYLGTGGAVLLSVLLLIFAAGLVAYGVHELNEAGIVPPIIEHLWDTNPPRTRTAVTLSSTRTGRSAQY